MISFCSHFILWPPLLCLALSPPSCKLTVVIRVIWNRSNNRPFFDIWRDIELYNIYTANDKENRKNRNRRDFAHRHKVLIYIFICDIDRHHVCSLYSLETMICVSSSCTAVIDIILVYVSSFSSVSFWILVCEALLGWTLRLGVHRVFLELMPFGSILHSPFCTFAKYICTQLNLTTHSHSLAGNRAFHSFLFPLGLIFIILFLLSSNSPDA